MIQDLGSITTAIVSIIHKSVGFYGHPIAPEKYFDYLSKV